MGGGPGQDPRGGGAGDRTSLVDEAIAFYLPQFHPTPENDEFWGPGFTEWTNVTAARPLYRGHRQPFLPADLGFYDLRVPGVRAAQVELARAHGVTAFCYWHYWFAGRRVLDRVITDVHASGEPDFPFCLAWGNQSWTGVWHGAPDRLLIEQTYPGADDHRRHFETLLPLFADPRYLRVDGRPVFYVQEPPSIPDVEEWVRLWQQLAHDAGIGGLFLVGEYHGGPWEPQHHGFDGSVAVRIPRPGVGRGFGETRHGPSVVPYARAHRTLTSFDDDEHFPCVVPRWDNTPRSGRRGLVLDGSTPELFREHVGLAVDKVRGAPPGRRIVWVKSWNEWAEGNTLEPDREHGLAYLEALRDGLAAPRRRRRAPREWSHEGEGGHPRLSRLARAVAQSDRRVGRDDADPVPVVLCIDCEPDPRMVDPADPPPLVGYQLVHDYFARWRERVEALTGAPVHLNWFFRMDPQVETTYGTPAAFVERHPDLLARARDSGDGLGVHPHAWRWDDAAGTWVGDLADAAFVRECLELAVATFRDAVGEPPELLRYGDAFLDDAVVGAADALGIRYDLTLEPGQPPRPVPETALGELATAELPDWRRVPRQPYHPDPNDYRRPASGPARSIRLVPLSSGPRWLGPSVRARLRARRDHGAGWKQRDPLYMALPYWTGANTFGEMLRRTLKVQRRPYLAFAIRTDWGRRLDHRRNIERCLDALLQEQGRRRFVFCTPAEACALLDGGAAPVSPVGAATAVSPRGSARTR
ncbi:MAG TPA: glycoside hydrolase family 99-like domain-containing protein [Acidimicrobiia bacterium]|nr:glycoside hydrolase family 99-like domain-containing protein [Acidimicrobiia bacterium]